MGQREENTSGDLPEIPVPGAPAEPATEEPAEAPEPAAPSEAPAQPSGPWDEKLAERFADAAQREVVSEFLRDTVQPYVTRLEQDPEVKNAKALYDDFRNSPEETFRAVATELFGADKAEAIASAIKNSTDDNPVEVPSEDEEDDAIALDELDPETRETVEWAREKRRQEAWDQAIKQVQEANPDVPIKEDLFRPFVIAADGDLTLAYDGYAQFVSEGVKEFAAPAEEPAEGEPAAEGDKPRDEQGRFVKAPPTIKDGQSPPARPPAPADLGEAIDSLFEDMAAANNPPPSI